ncbi:unnamed protein product [Trichogramma brassicae]|uniref:Uncharacterized protein n=1 Tax=Trichogramma brassicae TaxID=86971 RepID=A0A6H5J7Y5_9HYME|nr:unnamed protein product [Trichogramma brassicae]
MYYNIPKARQDRARRGHAIAAGKSGRPKFNRARRNDDSAYDLPERKRRRLRGDVLRDLRRRRADGADQRSGQIRQHTAALGYSQRPRKFGKISAEKRRDPNAITEQRSTPLHFICQACSDTMAFFETIDEVHRTVKIDARDKLGRTPLAPLALSCKIRSTYCWIVAPISLTSFSLGIASARALYRSMAKITSSN